MRAGICTPLWTGFEIKADVDWMKRYHIRGVVIGRRILFSEPAADITQRLFRHELEHAYQQMREGRILFYLKYFCFSVRYGYKANPFEIEARDQSNLPLTTTEEQLLWKLREGSQK